MPSFSIENDITPMRNRFFSSGLKGSEASYLNKAFGPSTREIKDTMDVYAAIDRQRDRDLAYQMNLESLQKRRDDASRERDIQSRVPDLIKQINGIKDSDTDPTSKAAALAGLQMENPYVSGTKLGAAMMGAAFKNLDYQARAQLKQENAAEKERLKERARLAPYAGAGAVDKVTEMIDADGVRTQDEQDAFEFAAYVRDAAKDTATQKQGSAERKGFLDAQNSLVTKGYGALDSIKYDKPPENTDPTQPAPPANLSKESRRDMERILARIQKKKLSDVRKEQLSDDDLQDTLYESVYDLEARLQGAEFPSINSGSQQTQRPTKTKTSSKWK